MFIELTFHGNPGRKFVLNIEDVSVIVPAEGCTRIDLRSGDGQPIYVRESYDKIRWAIFINSRLVENESLKS